MEEFKEDAGGLAVHGYIFPTCICFYLQFKLITFIAIIYGILFGECTCKEWVLLDPFIYPQEFQAKILKEVKN